jgi:hypothetical protein
VAEQIRLRATLATHRTGWRWGERWRGSGGEVAVAAVAVEWLLSGGQVAAKWRW